MDNNRLQKLIEFYTLEPNDPFNIYALAMEYKNHDRSKYIEYLNLLLDKFNEYVPTYYHAATFYIEKEEFETAKSILEIGIEKATNQKDNFALRELKQLYNTILFDIND